MAKTHADSTEASSSSSLPEPSRSDLSAKPARSSAPFALTSDGTLLINVDVLDTLDDAELRHRTLFVGAELAGRERRLALKLLDDAGHDLRARIAGGSVRRATKPKPA